MKKRLLLLSGMIACWTFVFAQAPDLIYYKFEDSSQVMNHATDPVGWLPAAITGTAHVSNGGFLGTGALTDTGGLRVPDGGVQTGWNTTVNGSFSLSFWYQPDSVQDVLSYLFGDSLAGYHCVSSISNGFATIMLLNTRSTSSFGPVFWFGVNPNVPHVFHLVHDGTPSKENPYGMYSAYMDGNLSGFGKINGPMITGSGLVIGSYAGSAALYGDINNLDGQIDEFRWYNRALTATEIANTWDIDVSHLGDCPTFTSFTMDSISGDGAKIQWTPGPGNTSYFLEYDTTGFTPGTGTMLTGTYPSDISKVILTGLNPETVYDIYLVEVCGSGDSVYTPAPYSFETTVPCLMPADLEVSNITATSADFNWSFLGSLQESYLIYGSRGFDPVTSGETDTAFSTFHTLQNLAEGTWYDVYLVANCGSGYRSDTVHIVFKTECHPIQAPFFEDFEDLSWIPRSLRTSISAANNNDTLNACWRRTPSWIADGLSSPASGEFDWAVRTGEASAYGPTSGQGGAGNYLYTESRSAGVGDEAIVYTPFIDVSTLTKPYLSFYYHRHGASQPDFYVEVNNGNGWATVITMKGPHQLQQTDAYDSTGIDISSFGDTLQLRFRTIYIGGGVSHMGLDNVAVKEAPPATCAEVTGIANDGMDQSTSVTLDILAEGHFFNLEWGPIGFEQGTGCLGQGDSPFTMDSCIGLNTIREVYVQNNCQDSGLGLAPWAGPFEFCTPFTAPYSIDFDNKDPLEGYPSIYFYNGEPGDIKPQCWEEYSAASLGAATQGIEIFLYSGRAFSDKNVLRLYDKAPTEGDTFMALTPRFIDMPEGNKQIRFVAYTPGSGSVLVKESRELVVGTMSSYTEGSGFHPIDTITISQTSWTEYTVPLDPLVTSYNGTDQIVALRYIAPAPPGGGIGVPDYCLIDDFHYEDIPDCLPPDMTVFESVFITDTEAKVNWISRSSGDNTLEWGFPGFAPGTGEAEGTATTADTTYHLTGLNAKTDYEIYIRTDCGGLQTYWVGPLKFRTACPIANAPYFEDFDGPQWFAPSRNFNAYNCDDIIGNCWSRIETCQKYGSTWTNTWGVQNDLGGVASQDHGGGGNYIFPVDPVDKDTAYIYSPVIDVSTLNNPYLSFYYHRFMSKVVDLWVSINDGQGWKKILFLTGQQQSSFTAPFRKAGVDISAYGDTVQIRFEAALSGREYNIPDWESYIRTEMAIDDIRIDEAPACNVPENLSVENRIDTSTGDWVTLLKWEDFQQLAEGYEVRVGAEGFADEEDSVTGDIVDTVTSKFYTIDTLKPNTCYEFFVRSLCETDRGVFEGPFKFCTPCAPDVAPYLYPFYSLESEFEPGLGCWRRESLGGNFQHMWDLGYNYIGPDFGPDEGMYASEYIYASPGTGGDTTSLYSPMIDIRQLTTPELSFYYHMYNLDDTLRVDLYDGLQWHNSVLKIGGPQQDYTYSPWKRIAMSLDSFNTTGFIQARFRTKKEGVKRGLVAIDEFRIADSLTCQFPFNFRFEDSLTTESTLRWSGEVADNYVIEYGPSGYTIGEGTEIVVSGDSVVIPVNDNRIYHGYIRSICGPGDTSDYVGPIPFYSKVLPCDDMEPYQLGPIKNQSTLFKGWDDFAYVGNPDYNFINSGGDAEFSDTYSVSGTQSLRIHDSGPNGFSDVAAVFDPISSGVYTASFSFFTGDNVIGQYDLQYSSVGGKRDAGFIFLDSSGTASVSKAQLNTSPITIGNFTYIIGQWNRVDHVIDFDRDTTWILLNGMHTNVGWQYSVDGRESQLDGVNWYTQLSENSISDCYIDDFCIAPYECPMASSLVMSQSTCTQAVIEWISGVDSSITILEYGTIGFIRGSGTALTTRANRDTLTGLAAGGNYDIYIGEICGYDTVFTGPLTITLPTEATADFVVNEGDPTATDLTVDFDGSISTGASEYYWDFGDGSSDSIMAPSYAYTANGNYEVQLIVESDCGRDTITKTVVISGISIEENLLSRSLSVYPNPTQNKLHISFETQSSEGAVVRLTDLSGKTVMQEEYRYINGRYEGELDLGHLAKGSYMLQVESEDLRAVKRVVRN